MCLWLEDQSELNYPIVKCIVHSWPSLCHTKHALSTCRAYTETLHNEERGLKGAEVSIKRSFIGLGLMRWER